MTNIDITELRRWSAEDLLGWIIKDNTKKEVGGFVIYDDAYGSNIYYSNDKSTGYYVNEWTPDIIESGQIWLVVEKMRGLDYYMTTIATKGKYCCKFIQGDNLFGATWHMDDNPCLAILLAAKAALEAQNG